MDRVDYMGPDVRKKSISFCLKDAAGVILKEGEIPAVLRAIAASKKKNDRVDARKIADLMRCNLLPEAYTAPTEIRDLRPVLRFRNHRRPQESVRPGGPSPQPAHLAGGNRINSRTTSLGISPVQPSVPTNYGPPCLQAAPDVS